MIIMGDHLDEFISKDIPDFKILDTDIVGLLSVTSPGGMHSLFGCVDSSRGIRPWVSMYSFYTGSCLACCGLLEAKSFVSSRVTSLFLKEFVQSVLEYEKVPTLMALPRTSFYDDLRSMGKLVYSFRNSQYPLNKGTWIANEHIIDLVMYIPRNIQQMVQL